MVAACYEPKIGDLVKVASRTWPGINKPGGVGKVSKVNNEDDIFTVNVDYILGGNDKAVELEFVEEHKFEEENHGRPSRRRRAAAADAPSAPASSKGESKQAAKKQSKKGAKKNALKDASSKTNAKSGSKRKLSDVEKSSVTKKKKAQKVAAAVVKTKARSSIKRQTKPSIAQKLNAVQVQKETVDEEKKSKNTLQKSVKPPIAPKSESDRVQKSTADKETKPKRALQKTAVVKETKPTKKAAPKKETNLASAESPPAAALITKPSAEDETPSRLSGFLKNVYNDMTQKASSFVQDIIGKSGSQPSSPESIASLDLKVGQERIELFNAIFSRIMRRNMVETIEIDELRTEINNSCKDKPFSELELRTQLERLDKESKIMVTWDTGTVYCL